MKKKTETEVEKLPSVKVLESVRTEVEKLMGDHVRSMGGHVRSVGVMGGQ